MSKIYHLVIYENGKAKGVSGARQKVIPEEDAAMILKNERPTIILDNGRFVVTEKRLFILTDEKKNQTLFIVVDCDKVNASKRDNTLVR